LSPLSQKLTVAADIPTHSPRSEQRRQPQRCASAFAAKGSAFSAQSSPLLTSVTAERSAAGRAARARINLPAHVSPGGATHAVRGKLWETFQGSAPIMNNPSPISTGWSPRTPHHPWRMRVTRVPTRTRMDLFTREGENRSRSPRRNHWSIHTWLALSTSWTAKAPAGLPNPMSMAMALPSVSAAMGTAGNVASNASGLAQE